VIHKISMPLFIYVGSKKFKLNFNQYHLWFHKRRNAVKQQYTNEVYYHIRNLKLKKIKLEFTFFPPDKRRRDRFNMIALHDKFFCDALVKFECIPDDNDNYIESQLYKTGEISKINPKVEIKIIEI
jgi:hypothetical protein